MSATETAAETKRPSQAEVLLHNIGGHWVASRTEQFLDVFNPARGEVIARAPLSTRQDVDTAVEAAKKAFPEWRDTPPVIRARAMFRFRALLEEISRISPSCQNYHGKTLTGPGERAAGDRMRGGRLRSIALRVTP